MCNKVKFLFYFYFDDDVQIYFPHWERDFVTKFKMMRVFLYINNLKRFELVLNKNNFYYEEEEQIDIQTK